MKRLAIVFILAFAAGAFGQMPQAKWMEFEGTKVRYFETGNSKSDKALVLVHCWTCNADFWRDSINAFPQYRVVAMDLPGHGGSDKPKVDYSMDYFARSVDAVMKKAKVKKAVLAGHSMGTPIMRRYYELYPKKTLGLVIVDGALLPFGPRADVDKFFEPLFKDYKAGAAKFVDGMLPTVQPELKSFIRTSMLATPDHVGASAMRLMLDDAYAEHGKINVPVLAVMAHTPFWPADLKERYAAAAPDLEFIMWTDASHFLMMEKPKEFNEAVSAFIVKKKLL